MNRLCKATAALLLGASVSIFAADAAEMTTADTVATSETTVAATETGRANDSFANGVSINDEIERIQHADSEERRELMNRFKNRLAHMNREERMETVTQLRYGMQMQNREWAREHADFHATKGMAKMGEKMGVGHGVQMAQPAFGEGVVAVQIGVQQGAFLEQQAGQTGTGHAQSGAQNTQMMFKSH